MPEPIDPAAYRDLVRRALAEDVGAGDVTTEAIVPSDRSGVGVFVSKAPTILAGLDVARHVFMEVDPDVRWVSVLRDGDFCAVGARIAEVRGRAASLLVAERTALNLLQALSGIATLTRAYRSETGG